jgi:CheY-like chemotaxis protein
MARLVVISANVAAAPLELGTGWATIGRADGNTLQIIEASISARHCEVKWHGEELLVRDLLSTNGLFIGGKKILEGALKPGELLRIGDVELRLETSSPSPGTSFISKMLMTHSAVPVAKSEPPKILPAENSATPDAATGAGKQFHVLFVDDSLAFLETFGGVCAEHGRQTWRVHTAPSAERALQMLQAQTIHLVVLDIGMPTLDGLQLLGLVRRRLPGLKIAVLTGCATECRRADALAGGADLFLEKPLTADGMKSIFNLLNDLVSWVPPAETALLNKSA